MNDIPRLLGPHRSPSARHNCPTSAGDPGRGQGGAPGALPCSIDSLALPDLDATAPKSKEGEDERP